MENNKMTAIEYFVKELETFGDPQICKITWEDLDSLAEQAKEMEKQQIIDAYEKGEFNDGMNGNAEQYYNETFK